MSDSPFCLFAETELRPISKVIINMSLGIRRFVYFITS